MPDEIARDIQLLDPGTPGRGSDQASFTCRGAPAFNLQSHSWDYVAYTWHTNRDTFDKLVFDDLKQNAMLVAMLAYQASEDPERMPRGRSAAASDSRTAGGVQAAGAELGGERGVSGPTVRAANPAAAGGS